MKTLASIITICLMFTAFGNVSAMDWKAHSGKTITFLMSEHPVLKGIRESDWPKIKSLVIEVHDIDGRLEHVRQLLSDKGFSQLHTESEVGLEDTGIFNIFALR